MAKREWVIEKGERKEIEPGVEDHHPHGLERVRFMLLIVWNEIRKGNAGATVNALKVAVNKSRQLGF
jgi:hypothetical protein